MPLAKSSAYVSPRRLPGGHLQTMYPSLFRKITDVEYTRERIEIPDGDFLDLDWSRATASRRTPSAVIISHGLEGSSDRAYVRGMARAFNAAGWDAIGWNFRGCSGEMNRLPHFYHSGAIDDLDYVVRHVQATHQRIALVGFSLGGNLTLKYLGTFFEKMPTQVVGAVTWSVPVDLAAGAKKMDEPSNRLYMIRFMRMLHKKIEAKSRMFPEKLSAEGLRSIKTFSEFDGRYTAPLHGFKNAMDYWTRASAKPVLPKIRVPTLLINALNDPFLTPDCFPTKEAHSSECFFLETPSEGGHVGFASFNKIGEYWSEKRSVEFILEL